MAMDFLFCTTSIHQKTSTFLTIRTHLLTLKSLNSLRVLQSLALENEIYEFWRKFCKSLKQLHAVKMWQAMVSDASERKVIFIC